MDGQGFSREVAFSQSVINIGADQGNDIVLRGSSVADFHVLMHYDSGHWSISPLNGDYRTTVNGRFLGVEGTILQNGSIVEIGTYRLTMMLNGVNTDIIIQSQGGADASSMDPDSIGSDRNILLEITKMDQTELEAGAAAEIELTVTNAGPLVANMQLQLQGIPSAWVQIIPPVLNLNEGRKGTFLVRISPPRNSSAEAGLYSMHFVAISPNYPRNTGIADTSITILPYSEFLISGPTPMQLKLSHGKSTDIADFVIINNSNAVGTYFVQSRDDSNELSFAYQKTGSGGLAAGQEMVTVRPGDSVQIPMEITARKIPLLGLASKHHHYYTDVTPSDRPGDVQTIAGEVMTKPAINTMVLLLFLVLLIIAVGIIFQPYIHMFDCQEGRRNQVIVAGSSAQLSWNVSGFATTITLNNGQTDNEVSNNGSQYVSPTTSTTYTITAENFISKLLRITHKKTVQVLVVPSRPAIDVFSVDKGSALFDETVNLNWSVEPNATAASITINKSTTQLAAENFTGKLAQGFQTDSLISLKAQNDSGYDLKSLFVKVASDNITLTRFTVWVRPNGIAVPEDNDVRRNTRWGSLQQAAGTGQPARSGTSGVNPQPAAQSNTLEIPDNYNTVGYGTQNLNPEVMAASGQTMPSTGTYSYQPPAGSGSGGAQAELLVSPSMNPTPVPTAAAPAVAADSVTVRSAPAPVTSPEGSSSNRDFTIKLAEVVEDPLADSGYRVIEYFPNYVLQKQEQILVEWNVDGVSKVKIENLSGEDLQNVGSEYAYPEKSTTYTLTAQAGETKKAYSLPVNVAGDADDGEGSGLKCELKANAATLKVPGTVMLTWTGGGNNRVQLISSTQAEKENADAEKQKEEEAKAKGENYEAPKNQALSGGTIGDYLQPSGFMRVNVDKQTTFVLNAYDAGNNVICTKSVEVKYEGGNDKKDIKLKITKIADEDGVSQPVYAKGQLVSYTVELTDFVKGTDPTGAIAITDGASTCSVNWPVNTCSFQAKKTGELTVTAVYAGDDNYKKVSATEKETVIDKMPTSIQINSAIKPAADRADVDAELIWDAKHSYGLVPGGIVTLTAGSTSCDVDMDTGTMTCAGEVEVKTVKDDGSIYISVRNMGLKDATPDRVTAVYKGDAYFMPSTSQSVLFRKINTQISIVNDLDAKRYPYKSDENHADLETLFSWVTGSDKDGNPIWGNTAVSGRTPTGTVTFILTDDKASDYGKCEYDLTGEKFSCEGTVEPGTEESSVIYTVEEMLLANPAADRVRAEYSGDSIFNASRSATVLFHTIPTALSITKAYKYDETYADLDAVLSWDNTADKGKTPSGTIKFTTRKGSETVTGTCELDLVKKTINCEPGIADVEKDTGKQTVDIVKLLLADKDSDRVKAEYSGDSFFEASESTVVLFTAEEKIDTDLILSKASKDSEGNIRLLTNLTWDKSKAGSYKPSGTIVYTSGPATCTLNIPSLKFDKCSGKAVLNDDGTYQITEMVMDGTPGEIIYAEYKGDTHFNGSVSSSVSFSKEDTTLDIESATKINDLITMTVVLEPAEDPTGTITFTSGSATCVLDITHREEPKFEACSGNVKFENGKFEITGMEMNGTPGESIFAKYSGDGAFNESTSPTVTFTSPDKTDTVTELTNAYMAGVDLVNFETILSWNKEDALAESPTGTITFTIGSDTCKLNVENNDFDCMGDSTEISGPVKVEPVAPETDVKYTWKFKDVHLDHVGADGIKAVYSGDTFFNPSASEKINFVTVETELEITEAQKSPSGNVKMKMELTWVADPPAGKTPAETITLTTGSKTCTLDITSDPPKFTDCDADEIKSEKSVEEKKWTFEITKLNIGAKIGSTISAKYSGDGVFLPSTAADLTYTKIKTETQIEKASKPEELYVDISDLILSWDTSMSDGKAPTGTVTLTFGSDASTVCKLDMKTGDFDCSDKTTKIVPPAKDLKPTDLKNPDPEKPGWKNLVWTLEHILLKNKTADRVKADYSGDDVFESSSSLYVLLHDEKIDTTLNIESASKKDNTVTLTVKLTPAEEETGTIIFTSGSGTCTMNIDDHDNPKFEKCSAKDVDYKDDGTIVITDMQLSAAPGDSIYAEYSGDSKYNKSISPTYSFEKINTTLDVQDPKKSDSDHLDLKAMLSWDEAEAAAKLPDGTIPTGTITFTIGSSTCKLSFDDESEGHWTDFTCSEKDGTVITPSYTDDGSTISPDYTSNDAVIVWTLKQILLSEGNTADRVKAEYSGDTNFNASASEFVLFDASKIDTVINIDSAVKKGDTVSLTAKLTPAGNESGTIVFTSGSGTCTLKIDDHANPSFEKCSGDPVTYHDDGTIEITGMHLSAAPGDSIYAEYSGDSKYNKSTSPAYYFEKVNTKLNLKDALKFGTRYLDLNALLSWDKSEAAAKLPSGTIPTGSITFTIGSDTCKLTFDDETAGHVKDFSCSEEPITDIRPEFSEVAPDEIITWTMKKILLSAGSTADRVKAEYSGDTNFNASSSEYILIDGKKISTEIVITDAEKTTNTSFTTANVFAKLSWYTSEAKEKKPKGTITFTAVKPYSESSSGDVSPKTESKCVYTIDTGILDCGGSITVPEGIDADRSYINYYLSQWPLDDKDVEWVKAEYSGDEFFEKSTSMIKLFTEKNPKIDTVLNIDSAVKKGDTVSLTLKLTPAGDESGTIIFTSGSGTCTLKIDDHANPSFEKCSADPVTYHDDGTIEITGMHLSAAPGDSIYAEYSGDSKYNKSTSPAYYFEKVDTNLDIEGAGKVDSLHVDLQALLSWDKTEAAAKLPAGIFPTGSITFTIGGSTCKLSFDDESEGHWTDFTCSEKDGTVITPSYTDDGSTISPDYTSDDAVITWTMQKILLSSDNPDRVKAEYSGDANFNASSSEYVLFEAKIDTSLDITEAYKSGTAYANLNTLLSWNKTEAGDKVPTGTITLTIGGDSCKLTFDGDQSSPGQVKDFTCSEKDVTNINPDWTDTTQKDSITWVMQKILLSSGSTADRVKAEYSGDANFNASTSEFVLFQPIPTALEITGMDGRYSTVGLFDVNLDLSWTEEPVVSGTLPEGTISLTIGTKVCTLDLSADPAAFTDCTAENVSVSQSGMKQTIAITKLDAGEAAENIVKAEYSGDSVFKPSKYEMKVDTTTRVTYPAIVPDGTVNVQVTLIWDRSKTGYRRDFPYYDLMPSGTIRLTAGSASCTIQLKGRNHPEATDCEARQVSLQHTSVDGVMYPEVVILGLNMGTVASQSIAAEYSGDSLFNKSSAERVFSNKVDTELKIDEAYRASENRVNLEATLSWCYYGCIDDTIDRQNPSGPVTFMLGSDSCKLTLADGSFSCEDGRTDVDIFDSNGRPDVTTRQEGSSWYKDWKLKLIDVLLSNGSDPDRVKAEFAGDGHFNASSSKYFLLEKIETQTRLNNQVKMPDGKINVDLFLSWMETPPDGTLKPTGTIKFMSGPASCTLDLGTKLFTGCSGEISGPTEEDKTRTYVITGMEIGDGKGESIQAEYSGDVIFMSSASNELFFTKVDTELEFTSAFKPNDPVQANTVAILSWDAEKAANRKPTGTVKYTAGSGSCTLDLSSEEMDCESLKPILIEPYSSGTTLGYKITIENMALSDMSADSIKAEYSGDPVFNASSGQKVLFKTVDTEIVIRSAYKPDEKHVTATAELDWDESDADGRTPRGTVKFAVGSGSCTLYLETEQLSCDPGSGNVSTDWRTFKVKDMLVDDSSADRISAEYSGDGFFNPSKSVRVLFDRIDTEISIPEAYKTGDAHVSLKALLSWNESIDVTDEDPLPTGTLKITVGEKVFTYDLETKQLTPEEGTAQRDEARQNYTFISLPFDDAGAETVKLEYSGDRYYGPSSVVHTFDKIKTETVVLNYNPGQEADRLTGRVIPEKYPPDGTEPGGLFDFYFLSSMAETQWEITCSNVPLNQLTSCSYSEYYPSYYPRPVSIIVTKAADGIYTFALTHGALTDYFEATVKYKGDTIFEPSQYKYEHDSDYKTTSISVEKAIQQSNGHKYVEILVSVRGEENVTTPIGRYVVTASNGKSCWFTYDYGVLASNCGNSFAVAPGTTSVYWYGLTETFYLRNISALGEEELSTVSVVYEGSETKRYHGSESSPVSFTDSNTGSMSIGTITTSYSGEVTATVTMPYTSERLLNYTYPAGPLVITKGNYTCTIPLRYGANSSYTLDLGDPSVSEDCGGGTVDVWSQNISSGSNDRQMVFELKNIPVSDHEAAKFKAGYLGDWYYTPNEAESDFHNRVNSTVSLSFSERQDLDYRYLLLTVSSADTSQTATPSGTMDILFKDRGGNIANHCVWNVEGSGHYFNCDQAFGGLSFVGRIIDPGSKTLVNTFTADRPFSTAYASAELSYGGDENYNPSSGSYPLPPSEVIITPLTDDLYDDGGRLYFNTNSNTKKFPKFPEIFNIADCDAMPGECRDLKHEVPLKVSIRVKDYHITDYDGHEITAWPFSEVIHFISGSEFDVSCTPVYDRDDGNDRLYTCEKEVSFSTTGIKNVHAGLNATWLNYSASAEFPEMVAVKIPDSPLYGTTFIIRPDAGDISVGNPVEVEADTTYNGTSIHPPSGTAEKKYIYYTWTGVDAGNTRIAACPDTGSTGSCSLDITDDAKWIVAEFLGNDTYAPSTGQKSVAASTVTLGLIIGDGG